MGSLLVRTLQRASACAYQRPRVRMQGAACRLRNPPAGVRRDASVGPDARSVIDQPQHSSAHRGRALKSNALSVLIVTARSGHSQAAATIGTTVPTASTRCM